MLELTETAKSKLHKSLITAGRSDRQDTCFRIVPKGDKSLTLKLAKPAQSDVIYTYCGEKVLALPKALESHFRDKRLDIDDAGKLKFH